MKVNRGRRLRLASERPIPYRFLPALLFYPLSVPYLAGGLARSARGPLRRSQRDFDGGTIGGVCGQLAQQPPVGFGQGVIRQSRLKVVQCMITQAHGGPQFAEPGPMRVVDRVEHLGQEMHRAAVASIAMRGERPQGVQQQHKDGGRIKL